MYSIYISILSQFKNTQTPDICFTLLEDCINVGFQYCLFVCLFVCFFVFLFILICPSILLCAVWSAWQALYLAGGCVYCSCYFVVVVVCLFVYIRSIDYSSCTVWSAWQALVAVVAVVLMLLMFLLICPSIIYHMQSGLLGRHCTWQVVPFSGSDRLGFLGSLHCWPRKDTRTMRS